MSKHTFILNNLHCANCGAKIEDKMNTNSQINSAILTFATKKLLVDSPLSEQELTPLLQQICDSIEDGVTVMAFEDNHTVIAD